MMKSLVLRVAMFVAIVVFWQTAAWGATAKWAVREESAGEVIQAPSMLPDLDKSSSRESAESPPLPSAPDNPGFREGSEEASAPSDETQQCPDCQSGCGKPDCDERPRLGLTGIVGFDSFKGVSDEGLSHFGMVTGLNAGGPLPVVNRFGLGWQIGSTYAVYDFEGKPATLSGEGRSGGEQETFITAGFFRKGWDGRPLSFGLVYDWMINDHWGFVPTAGTLGQWRMQVEYALSGCNSLGVYGTLRERASTISRDFADVPWNITTRPINQLDIFWHHKFACGADGKFWIGFPEQRRADSELGGSLGEWILGAQFEVPLAESVALYANVQYMKPSADASSSFDGLAAAEESYNVGLGLIWYPGRSARTRTVTGGCWTPYLPVANNSTFLVDQAFAGQQ